MLIRFPAAARVQACWRPSLTIARALHECSGGIVPVVVPPRAACTRTRLRQQPAVQAIIPTRTMSSNGFSSAAAAASPAPAASTPPVPGSSPSQPASAGPAGPGGAAPAPPQARAETQPTVEDDTASTSPNGNAKENGQEEEEEQGTTTDAPKPLPALPSPESVSGEGGDGVRTVHVNGQPIALDALGPMVVNRDGTISRIANWPEMTEIERENTLRILCKRNQLRLGNLRAGRPADAPQEGSS
ncbi:hypothetical protein VTG60DRAFT_2291 [Thermothelomyces hinnuleus]